MPSFRLLVLWLFFVSLTFSVSGASCDESEPNWSSLTPRQQDSCQLVKLWTSTNGASWTTPWDLTKQINLWPGVTLLGSGSSARVRFIIISNNKVTGSLPVLNLPELTTFRIINNSGTNVSNRISGTLPDLSGLPKLEELNLSYNAITGSLPGPGDLPVTLKVLNMTGNQLSGSIPAYEDRVLEQIRLSNNSLTGSIPSFEDCDQLTYIDLSQNALNTVPDFELPGLQTLLITQAGLTGNVPFLSGCPLLKVLNLGQNSLTGGIPSFSGLNYLQELRLNNNELTGSVPDFGMSSLAVLVLNNNSLTGSLPAFNSATGLTEINISVAGLSGNLPSFQYNSSLVHVQLFNNNLEGAVPDYNLPLLRTLNVSNNKLSGAIPNFNLGELLTLNLSNNDFRSALPNFNLMPKLTTLNVYVAGLCGSLPAEMVLPELTQLWLYNNNFSGTLPSTFIRSMQKLRSLNMYSIGNVGGSIPDFSSPELTTLVLYRNFFTGPLPSFANAPKLKTLYLQQNLLSGPVPDYKARPGSDTSNMYIDLTFNNFSFGDLATSPYNSVNRYGYRYQIIPLIYNAAAKTLSVDPGFVSTGSENTYAWKKVCGGVTTDLSNNSAVLSLPTTPDGCRYYCQITNSILTQSVSVTLSSTAPHRQLLLGSHNFIYNATTSSLCNFDSDPFTCQDVYDKKLEQQVRYTGTEEFLKGKTYLDIKYPGDIIQANHFSTVSLSVGILDYETPSDPDKAKLILPDMSAELIPLMDNGSVSIGKSDFDVREEELDASSSLDLDDIDLAGDCSSCSELTADFIYFYTDRECGINNYDPVTRTITIPFRYADYELNTALPAVKFYYRTNITGEGFTEVSSGNVVYNDGRYQVTFVLPASAIDASKRFNYKVEAVSESGRRFMEMAMYTLETKQDVGLAVHVGPNTDRFDVIENLRHPTCDMYWNIRYEAHHAEILNTFTAQFFVNDVLTFNGNLPEVTHGYGSVQVHAIMKGGFNVARLPSCYRLKSYLININPKVHMEMDYKIMCKER